MHPPTIEIPEDVLLATAEQAVFDLEEGECVVRADRRMRHADLRNRGVSFGDDPENLDRPPFRIRAIEVDEVRPAADSDLIVRPFEDEVVGKQLSDRIPVPRLNAAPELRDDLAAGACRD